MTHKKLTLVLLAGSALLGAATAHAQPGGQGGPGGGFGGPGMNQRADFRNLTQEQRREMQEKMRAVTHELTLRMMLDNAAVTDKAVQDTIIAFSDAQEAAVQRLRENNRDLQMALNDNAMSNTQIVALQNTYAAAAEDEMVRREKALALLDKKINYSTQPRLKAVLTILGLMGDAVVLSDTNSNTGGGFGGPGGGFGGPGGGFGGPGGGFGGPGGGFGGPGGGFGGGPGGGFGGGPGGRGGGPGGRGGQGDGQGGQGGPGERRP